MEGFLVRLTWFINGCLARKRNNASVHQVQVHGTGWAENKEMFNLKQSLEKVGQMERWRRKVVHAPSRR